MSSNPRTLKSIIIIVLCGGFVFGIYYSSVLLEREFCEISSSDYLIKKMKIKEKISEAETKGQGGFDYYGSYKDIWINGLISLEHEDKLSVGDSVRILFPRKDASSDLSYWVKDHPCDTIYWDSVKVVN